MSDLGWIELDSEGGADHPLKAGIYRVRLEEAGQRTEVTLHLRPTGWCYVDGRQHVNAHASYVSCRWAAPLPPE